MANREKGEISLTVNGTVYTLALDINALAALEDLLSPPNGRVVTFPDVIAKVNAGSIKYMRALVWAALQMHHPHTTLAQAGRLIQEIGGIDGLAEQLGVLSKSTEPDANDVKALGVKDERPPRAQAKSEKRRGGTGETSTATRAASA